MGQITQAFIDMTRDAHRRGDHMSATINEEEQLLWAWEELQRLRLIEQVMEECDCFGKKLVALTYNIATCGSCGVSDNFTWSKDSLKALSCKKLQEILDQYKRV